MKVPWFSMPKDGEAKSQQDQDQVNCDFWLERCTGQTINKEFYLNAPCWLRDAIQWKCPQLWAIGNWQLHHDNTPAHASCLVHSFLAKHHITQGTSPHYSQDLVPFYFSGLFPKLKSPWKGRDFRSWMRFRKLGQDSWWWFQQRNLQIVWIVEEILRELCEVPRGLHWRGLKCHCPLYNVVSCSINIYFS